MCEIYNHKCKQKGCKVVVDMHLEDFATDRKEIEVFCAEHMPPGERRKTGIVWEYWDPKKEDGDGIRRLCFIRYLTENAFHHAEGNCPNAIHCRSVERWGNVVKTRKRGK